MDMHTKRRLYGVFQPVLCTLRIGCIDQLLVLAADVQLTRQVCKLIGSDGHRLAGCASEDKRVVVEDDSLHRVAVHPPRLRFRFLEVLHGAAQQ
ncbi:hypothetical protein D3C76_789260 [compost metagenome]